MSVSDFFRYPGLILERLGCFLFGVDTGVKRFSCPKPSHTLSLESVHANDIPNKENSEVFIHLQQQLAAEN